MKLKSFNVERYRSITTAKQIKLGKTTVLVGPNNEGKSNLLRALVLAMTVLTRGRDVRFLGKFRRIYYRNIGYDWDLDFPINLQENNPDGKSVIILEFSLSDMELDSFHEEVKSQITGTLPIRIAIGRKDVEVTFHKKGKWSAQLSKKSEKIAEFVSTRLEFEHIHAIRTAESAENIVNEMVGRELGQLEKNDDYIQALKKIEKLQSPILSDLSDSMLKTFKKFLPQVKKVEVRIRQDERFRALRRAAEIIVNDGTPTLLSHKGDGAQSLAALAIIQHASERSAKGKNLVIAIEEPESHLHSNAIHELRHVIEALSEQHQVILTTHNPLFVDRRVITNNIIVKDRKAWSARSIEEVRNILGVRAADNLRHAELVLLVEGDDDKIALEALLKHYSLHLRDPLQNGTLALDSLGGAGNLAYKISHIKGCICLCHVFLDYDSPGKDAHSKAKARGLIEDCDVNYASCAGLSESELEDLYEVSFYKDLIWNKYRVSLESPKFKSKKKWSDRLRECFISQGKNWDDDVKIEVKLLIAKAVESDPGRALNQYKKSVFDALTSALEERLKDKSAQTIP